MVSPYAVVRVERIKQIVADRLKVSRRDLSSCFRTKEVSWARHLALYLCRQHVNASFPELGLMFLKDHTSVIYACKKIKVMREKDNNLDALLTELEAELHHAERLG